MLAVQETNFLYSFSQAGFVALQTACCLLIDGNFKNDDQGHAEKSYEMLGLSLAYSIYGVVVSIYLYGRKTDYLRAKYGREDAALVKGLNSSNKQTVDNDEDLFDI